MIFLALTVKVLTQDIGKEGQDAEQRKAKLKSLLVLPSSSSALPRTNAQQAPSKSSQDIKSSTTQPSVFTTHGEIENEQITTTLSNEDQEMTLIRFLESIKKKLNNHTSAEINETKTTSSQVLGKGCNFEQDSGTLNCKDGIEFFGINLAYSQVLKSIHDQRQKNASVMQLSRIDIFSCNIPIMFSFNHNNSEKQNDGLKSTPSRNNVKTIAIINSKMETIEDSAFDEFLQTLIQLDLSNNKLDRIPSAVLRLSHLIDLNLSGNQISQLPVLPPNLIETRGSFRNLVRLSSLNLGNNRWVIIYLYENIPFSINNGKNNTVSFNIKKYNHAKCQIYFQARNCKRKVFKLAT